jgi:hypothetical protein
MATREFLDRAHVEQNGGRVAIEHCLQRWRIDSAIHDNTG